MDSLVLQVMQVSKASLASKVSEVLQVTPDNRDNQETSVLPASRVLTVPLEVLETLECLVTVERLDLLDPLDNQESWVGLEALDSLVRPVSVVLQAHRALPDSWEIQAQWDPLVRSAFQVLSEQLGSRDPSVHRARLVRPGLQEVPDVRVSEELTGRTEIAEDLDLWAVRANPACKESRGYGATLDRLVAQASRDSKVRRVLPVRRAT